MNSTDYSTKIALICRMAAEVYAELGPGHLESIYHNAMKLQMQDHHFGFESERDLPVTFRGRYVGTVRADLVVDNQIVLEFKITGKMDDAEQQCRQYMKLTKIPYGICVIFSKKDETKKKSKKSEEECGLIIRKLVPDEEEDDKEEDDE